MIVKLLKLITGKCRLLQRYKCVENSVLMRSGLRNNRPKMNKKKNQKKRY